MNCKKCNKEFEPIKGLVNYCSLQCRNSREWTDGDKLKKSIAAKKKQESYYELIDNKKVLKAERINYLNERKEYFKNNNLSAKIKDFYNQKLLKEDFNNLSFERLRKRILIEQNNQCNHCGLIEWRGKVLSLEIDHIDGNNKNNSRDNLEALCPNCHSITDTWRGRNKNKEKRKSIIKPEEFISAYLLQGNIRKALISLNLSAKGGNYARMYKFLTLAGINYKNG